MTVRTRTPEGSARGTDEGTVPAEPRFERVDLDRYVVIDGAPIGYVEVVPPVIVCYSGHPYPRAVEIAQVHDFHRAVQVVVDHADSRRRPMISA
ncbi:hypothetical protein [Microbacterium sp. XT11]|uniref:hypothetical protein n=1 Tax=Microbacterium sp. XT11 TaxID=367477 RepID=UPI000742F5F7|nr:hypothetical protein [Microbacterium sp. XT11]ALX66325.1 hypothetical protein AB663_001401 [Microbacterium sp. XT11]